MFNKLLYGTSISSRGKVAVRGLSHRLLSKPLAATFLQTRTVVVRPKCEHILRNEFPLTKSAFITNSRGFSTDHSSVDQASEGWLSWLGRNKKVIALVTISLLALGGRKLDSLRVVKVGDLGLHELVREVSPGEIGSERIEKVIDDLVKVMRKHKLVSLSAPQIGVPLEIIVVDEYYRRGHPPKEYYEAEDKLRFDVFFNPKLEPKISIKGFLSEFCFVVVEGLDRYGQPKVVYADGQHARDLQHACDYQGGTLYDKMD